MLFRSYGVKKVYAVIHNINEQLAGSIAESIKQIDHVTTYNETIANTGKIDAFWIDYEFWDTAPGSLYCVGCTTTDGCGNTTTAGHPAFGFRANNTGFTTNGAHTVWGFNQFQNLIFLAESTRVAINAACSTCNMIMPEILLSPNFDFNIDDITTGMNPFNMSPSGTPPFKCLGCDLEQSLAFAKFLEVGSIGIAGTGTGIGSLAVDLTTKDNRFSCTVSTGCTGTTCCAFTCLTTQDPNNCNASTPDHFLTDQVENVSDNAHYYTSSCTDPNPPNHFSNAGGCYRQRCLDFLGSWSTGNIPICPYFSTENINLGSSENNLGNYMIGDNSSVDNSAFGLCGSSSTHPSAVHFFKDIHWEFMRQYYNSWKSSFVQDFSGSPLYTDPFFGTSLDFDHFQQPQSLPQKWGAYPSSHPHANLITIGSMEWFPMNNYPLVLDNSFPSTASSVSRVTFNNTSYPLSSQPPLMQINVNRSGDGYYDIVYPCFAAPFRKIDPNGNNKIKTGSKSISAKIYPNPSDGNYNLSYSLPSGNGVLQITDMMGRMVFNQVITGSNGLKAINTSFLGNGIYYWKLTDDSGTFQTGRITILKLN